MSCSTPPVEVNQTENTWSFWTKIYVKKPSDEV